MEITSTYFIIASLAVWRLTHLLAKEDGPFDIIFLMRQKAGAGFFGSLLDCFYCVSVWVAFPIGCWLGADWPQRLLLWLALSGAACLAEQCTAPKKSKPETPVFFEEPAE